MAREGIYVGGKEIIQRYVGDRLVWEKLIQVAHFENYTDWERDGPLSIKRTITKRREYGQPKPSNINYEVTKVKVNGKMYDVKNFFLLVVETQNNWVYDFLLIFKSTADLDEVDRIYQKDIYFYKKRK